ncbi:MAG TPA: hypothetical protein VLX44_07360 [Xanthobacteraceae bacterium]|nr:hypothetical protein [Xanthobacteraceae bacterium]
MSTTDQVCLFCKQGHVSQLTKELTFRQTTDRGPIVCRIAVPVGRCSKCGAETFDAEAEAMIESAVRREYEKLPPAPGGED